MFRRLRSIVCLGIVLAIAPAGAYYHYIRFTSRVAPYGPAPEKYDLNALPDKTLTFYVSDQGPSQYSAGDSFESVLNQINEAAAVWNGVATSDLRVAFGGIYRADTVSSIPFADVVFEELPPGVLGLGGPTAREEIRTGANGLFVPITRATVRISRDLTQRPGPSYSDAFFLTVLHEMGHALGLQHTLTSSAMATDVTRASSRARPIDDDDVAGLSLLYPARGFPAGFGSMAGRVTAGGQGVHLASVVAIRPGGGAISVLTNPDGTFRIDGLPQGQYLVYSHPLPPATQTGLGPANVVLPLDPDSNSLAAGGAFDTVFFPGTRDPGSAMPLTVAAGSPVENVNFFVQPRPAPAIYGVTTYSFYGSTAVRPGYLNVNPGSGTLVVYGAGLTSGTAVASGLAVGALDGSAVFSPGSFRTYGNPVFLAFDLLFNLVSGSGPRHLIFGNGSDIHVVPSALQLVKTPPPSITSVTQAADAAGNQTAILTGTNLLAETRYYFGGAPAIVRSFDPAARQAVVAPPPAAAGYRAIVTAANPDGQTSMFLQSQTPPVFVYPAGDAARVSISPGFLRAGAEAMLEINGLNTHFADGYTLAGFGNADVVARRVFVLGPRSALVNVAVAPAATPGALGVNVISGLESAALPAGLQILPANSRSPVLNSKLQNAAAGSTGVYPGAFVLVPGSNLAGTGTPWATLREMATGREIPVTVTEAQTDRFVFRVPADWPVGPTVLKYFNGTEEAGLIAVSIDAAPPVVTAILNTSGETLDAARNARAGDTIVLQLSGAGEAGKDIAISRWKVDVGGIAHSPAVGSWSASTPGVYSLQLALSPTLTPGQKAVAVSLDGRTSPAYPLYMQP